MRNIYLLVTLFLNVATALAAAGAPESGQPHTVTGLGLPMVWIGPGIFTMGSPVTEGTHEPDEKQHRVTLSGGFWLGTCEVTVAQWTAFAKASGYQTEADRGDGVSQWIRGQWVRVAASSWKNPGFKQTGLHPVVGVSWNDAMAFCAWLTERERAAGRLSTKFRYTLPTEAQWEYACRAGYDGPWLPDVKNMNAEIWYRFGDGLGGILAEPNTQLTGVRRANAWGLHDVHGNVFEWCRDWYDPTAIIDATDPVGPTKGTQRVCRGGAWSSYPASVRSAFRGRDEPSNRGTNLGFRLCLSEGL